MISARSPGVRKRVPGIAFVLALGWVVCLLPSACVSKSRAKSEAQKAFIAGQQEAVMRMQQAQGPTVIVSGQVRNSFVPWSSETTLAKAIVQAGYYGHADPKEILIVRKGKGIQVDVQRLLGGEDVPLEAGDVVHLQ